FSRDWSSDVCSSDLWCWHKVFRKHPYDAHIGSVYKLLELARAKDEALLMPAEWSGLTVQPGDAFIQLHGDPDSPGPGHTGFVLRVSDDGDSVVTVEGNLRNAVRIATRSVHTFDSAINPYGRLCGEHSSVSWERGLIEAPMAGASVTGTR